MKHQLSQLEKILLERKDESLTLAFLRSVNFEDFSDVFLRYIFREGSPEMKNIVFSIGTLSHSLIDILLETDLKLLQKWLKTDKMMLTFDQHRKLLDSGDHECIEAYFSAMPWQCDPNDPMEIIMFPANFGYGDSPQKLLLEHGYIIYAGQFGKINDYLSSPELDAEAKEKIIAKIFCVNVCDFCQPAKKQKAVSHA